MRTGSSPDPKRSRPDTRYAAEFPSPLHFEQDGRAGKDGDRRSPSARGPHGVVSRKRSSADRTVLYRILCQGYAGPFRLPRRMRRSKTIISRSAAAASTFYSDIFSLSFFRCCFNRMIDTTPAAIETNDQKLPAASGPIHGVVSLNKFRTNRLMPYNTKYDGKPPLETLQSDHKQQHDHENNCKAAFNDLTGKPKRTAMYVKDATDAASIYQALHLQQREHDAFCRSRKIHKPGITHFQDLGYRKQQDRC